jgi:hypothetical protein
LPQAARAATSLGDHESDWFTDTRRPSLGVASELHHDGASRKIDQSLRGGRAVPHNFIRISAITPNPGLRDPDHMKRICKKHNGTFQCLLFDAETNPGSAYVLVKNGNVDAILADFGGGETIFQYFDPSEMK